MEVSPGKASRTPKKNKQPKFEQVLILSKSRFFVLSRDDEEGAIIKNQGVNEDKEKVRRKNIQSLNIQRRKIH